jgi:hypothetical protein
LDRTCSGEGRKSMAVIELVDDSAPVEDLFNLECESSPT